MCYIASFGLEVNWWDLSQNDSTHLNNSFVPLIPMGKRDQPRKRPKYDPKSLISCDELYCKYSVDLEGGDEVDFR